MTLDPALQASLSEYFDKFNKLSDRAAKHWPLPESSEGAKEEADIGYHFGCIMTAKDLELKKNRLLISSFFTNLYGRTSFNGTAHLKPSEIQTRIRQQSWTKASESPPETAFQVCTFLILAHIPGESIVRAGCVGHYFGNSQTIIIESIWLARALQRRNKPTKPEANCRPISGLKIERSQRFCWLNKAVRRPISGLETEFDELNLVIGHNSEQNQQTVLGWLLTYSNPEQNTTQAALAGAIVAIEQQTGQSVAAVFLEAENPVALIALPDTTAHHRQQAADRLAAFYGIGVQYVKFAYESPNAHPRQHNEAIAARCYFLLTIPQVLSQQTKLTIDSVVVMKFIVDHTRYRLPTTTYSVSDYTNHWAVYTGLTANNKPKADEKKAGSGLDSISRNSTSLFGECQSKNSLDLYLHNIPRREQPRFNFRRSSVGFEILVDEDYFEPVGLQSDHDMAPPEPELTRWGRFWSIIRQEWFPSAPSSPVALYCPVAHSGETDLFAYKYQSEPPYFTRYYALESDAVTVQFPSYSEFTSEGRMEHIYRLPNDYDGQKEAVLKSIKAGAVLPQFTYSVGMTACVSYTYFLKSAVRVWHVVLKPDTDQVSELEIIKLMRFFSGSQEHQGEEERRKLMRRIQFSVPSSTRADAHQPTTKLIAPLANWVPGWSVLVSGLKNRMNELLLLAPKKPGSVLSADNLKAVADRWLKVLAGCFPQPTFSPAIHYRTDADKRIQRRAWRAKTAARLVVWTGLGMLTIGLWGYLAPFLPKPTAGPAWVPDQQAGGLTRMLTFLYLQILWLLSALPVLSYGLAGLFILRKCWTWLFRGGARVFRAVYTAAQSRMRAIFIEKELPTDNDWLTNPDNLIKLLQDLTGVHYVARPDSRLNRHMAPADQAVSLRNVRSGVVEIDTGNATFVPPGVPLKNREKLDASNFLQFYTDPTGSTADALNNPSSPDVYKRNRIRVKVRELYQDLYEDDIQMKGDPEPFSEDEYADYVFKAYCGICLGIFDYDRMGFEEIDDTFVPLPDSKTDTSFMVIHRGVLAKLGYDDDVMNTFWDTLGMSAYLLIPSAVLAHNDMVARDAESRLDRLLNDLRLGRSTLAIRELNEERVIIDDLLNDDMLGDVFQYKTEQELYREGMQRRGIGERLSDARGKLEQLEKIISDKHADSTRRYEQRITYLASLVGVFSFYTIVHDYLLNELAKGSEQTGRTIPWQNIPFNNLIDNLGVSFSIFAGLHGDYNGLRLAHFIIVGVFIILFMYLLLSNLTDPNRNRTYFWERSRRRSRTLPNTHHAPPAPTRSSAKR